MPALIKPFAHARKPHLSLINWNGEFMKGVLSLVVSSMILLALVGPAQALHIVTFPFTDGPTVTDGSFVTTMGLL